MPLLKKTVGGFELQVGTMSDFQVKMYSRDNCRACHGRGVQHMTLPDESVEVHTCECVDKRLAKLAKNESWLVYTVTSPQNVCRVYCGTSGKFRTVVKSLEKS